MIEFRSLTSHRDKRLSAQWITFIFLSMISALAGCQQPTGYLMDVWVIAGDSPREDTPHRASRLLQRLHERGDCRIESLTALPDRTVHDNSLPTAVLLMGSMSPVQRASLARSLKHRVANGVGIVLLGSAAADLQLDPRFIWLTRDQHIQPMRAQHHWFKTLDPLHPVTLGTGRCWELSAGIHTFSSGQTKGMTPLVKLTASPPAPIPLVPMDESCTAANVAYQSNVIGVSQVGMGRIVFVGIEPLTSTEGQEQLVNIIHNALRWAGGIAGDMRENAAM
jgi:hypothetical protein